MTQTHMTLELVRAALSYIPANVPRDEWARVAMAIKSEFPDDAGFVLFDAWSQQATTAYDAAAARATWRSVKPDGGVTIGTLLHLAKQRGFAPRKDAAMPGSGGESGQAQGASTAHALVEREQAEAAHARAADEAAQVWALAGTHNGSRYLQRKGVQAYGLRFLDDWALVPLRDAEGKLWNLQRIAPEPPAGGGSDKLFLKGGRKSGLWHMLGEPIGSEAVLIAEGYATAASIHQATGRPVAVAFDAGNLVHVAKALHQLHPKALLVLCGDDDAPTFARTGRNPGRDKATAAARQVRGLAMLPKDLPDGGTDFNDLHQARGLEAVRQQLEAGLSAELAQQAVPAVTQASGAGERANTTRNPPSLPNSATTEGPFDPFVVEDSGVWHVSYDRDSSSKRPEWVCSRLDVEARTRDLDGAGWGYLLKFTDPIGHAKQWAMPARMLSGDGGEYRAALLNMGLRIAPSPRARNLLTQYIQTREPEAFAVSTDRIGWHGRAFVLPKETIGDDGERVVFQSETAMDNTFRTNGTAQAWRERVGALCAGNSRLVFAVSAAFAGPLLRPAGVESGGFHFRGDSSSGKTTALKVAASVYGGPSYLQRWRTTDNALEAIAAQHCDCMLPLDELAQVDPKTAGECAYMLANEQSKARATRTGTPRARLTWRILFLSAGELGLADHMAEGMKRARVGQEVRMADIPADAGAGLGAFETLHGWQAGGPFASNLAQQAGAVYGVAGRAWLQWLTENADSLKARIRAASDALAAHLIPDGASGQVQRVGGRFALVGAAGELATAAGVTGWEKGEAERATRACFAAWLASRGGIGNGEVSAMLRQVRRFFEAHGEGRFTWWHRGADDHNARTMQRAGFRRMLNDQGEPIKSKHGAEFGDRMPVAVGEGVSVEYFVLPEVFRTEVCAGFDARAVATVLRDHRCLVHDKGTLTERTRLPGLGLSNCYRVAPKLFELEL